MQLVVPEFEIYFDSLIQEKQGKQFMKATSSVIEMIYEGEINECQ